jgi:crossover junction endodeoxyribonuclease RuvC
VLIMGIDPGLAHVGWALISALPDGSHAQRQDSGTIETAAALAYTSRLDAICQALIVAGASAVLHPDTIALEYWPGQGSSRQADYTGNVCGAIRALAIAARVPAVEYGAKRVKKALTGQPHASKYQVILAVRQALGYLPRSDHEADALAIALTHLQVRGNPWQIYY